MDVEITAYASPPQIERLRSALSRVGFHPLAPGQACCPGRRPLELLYVAGSLADTPEIEHLLVKRSAPFGLLVADRDLFQTGALLDHALDFCCWPVDDLELATRLKRAAGMVCCHGGESGRDACVCSGLVGRSAEFRAVLERIHRLASVDANVLISGETGTGKELVAHAIHALSPRHNHPFQAVNCGAIPENLVENELFGHCSGAYTDARDGQAGLIEQADGGTLFLDEVDMLPPKAQSALLRFIESRVYRPLGGRRERHADTRIVAATNADLEVLAVRGGFRSDLFYRLNLLNLRLPALRRRREDLSLLVEHFLDQCERLYRRGHKVLHPFTRARIVAYHWPGNVRELENFVHREYLLADSSVIVATPFPDEEPPSVDPSPPASFRQAKEQAIAQFESDYVRALLGRTAGNITRAASLAGKERRAFGRLVKKYGIDPRQFSSGR